MKMKIRNLMILMLFAMPSIDLFAISEEKEIELGREEHKKIISQYGVYENKALQEYVTMVGKRVAAFSSRPNLDYQFTVLNDAAINAFALPGGFIYITRGMLTHMNSESELAAVLGHEIAHVTERHALRRNRARTGVNLINSVASAVVYSQVGSVASAGISELGSMYGGVLVTGYSREYELEADEVGARFMAKAGYNPQAMLRTIDILKAKDRIEIEQARLEKRKPQIYHGFLSTHPDHDTRYRKAIQASMNLSSEYSEFITTDDFLEKLNGLAYGSTRQVGVIRGNIFYHPKLGIKLRFPDQWRVNPTSRGVQIVSRTGDASFFITTGRLGKDSTPESYATKNLGLNVREGRSITIGDYPAFLGIADRGESFYGTRPLRFAILFDPRRRLVFELYGSGQYDLRKIANDRDFIATSFSFDARDLQDFRKAKVPRLQVVRAENGITMEGLAEKSPITNYALDKLRVMNGLYPNGQPEPGTLIKIVD